MFDKYEKIVVVDFETSGLDYKKEKIIEIGMIVLSKNDHTLKFELVEEYNKLIKIDFKLEEIITNLTGITDEMLKNDGVLEEHVYEKLKETLCEKTLVVAYNLQFDISFLIQLLKKYNSTYCFECDCLDIMAVYKDRYNYPHKLKDSINSYQVTVQNTHRAIDDAKATFEVFKKMILEKNNVEDYINVLGFNPKYGVSGMKLNHITYISQYGGKREIEKFKLKG